MYQEVIPPDVKLEEENSWSYVKKLSNLND